MQAAQQAPDPNPAAARLALLSAREREVLNRVLMGKQTRVIADDFCISVKTVEFYRARIREKLDVALLAELFPSPVAIMSFAGGPGFVEVDSNRYAICSPRPISQSSLSEHNRRFH